MAKVLKLKPTKPSSRRSRGEGGVGAPATSCGLSTGRHNADITTEDSKGEPPITGLLKQAIIPVVILLCSMAAFSVVIAHMSGRPSYSARNNVSSPVFPE